MKTMATLLIAVFMISAFAVAIPIVSAAPGPLQQLIDGANSGDTLLVDPGTYPEAIVLLQSIILQAKDLNNKPVVNSIHIKSSDVSVIGFEVVDASAKILGEAVLVYINPGDNIKVLDCIIHETKGTPSVRGIVTVIGGNYVDLRIRRNEIYDVTTGIYVNPHTGIFSIEDNEIHNCVAGIGGATGANIMRNYFHDNDEAMGVDDSLVGLTVKYNFFDDPANNWGSVTLVAEYNYWGTGDPALIASTMINQQGPKVGDVDFDPWLEAWGAVILANVRLPRVSISVTPGSINFGIVVAGKTATETVVVRNTGETGVTVTAELHSDPTGFYEDSLTLAPNLYDDTMTLPAPDNAQDVVFTLTVSRYIDVDTYQGLLIFWAEEILP